MNDAGYKRAALALSTADKVDREWILKNLEIQERDRLAQALAQVEAMGARAVAQEADALSQQSVLATDSPSVLSGASPVSVPDTNPTPAATATSRQRVARADAAEMHRTLAQEPDWIIAALCGIAHWNWQPGLLKRLSEARRERLLSLMRTQPDHRPLLQEAVVDAVARRLVLGTAEPILDLDSEEPPAPPRGRWAASLSRLTSWLL